MNIFKYIFLKVPEVILDKYEILRAYKASFFCFIYITYNQLKGIKLYRASIHYPDGGLIHLCVTKYGLDSGRDLKDLEMIKEFYSYKMNPCRIK